MFSDPYLLAILIGFGLALCWAAGMEEAADEMRREQNDWRGLPSPDLH